MLLRQFIETSEILILITTVTAIIVYYIIVFTNGTIVLQAKMKIKGGKRNKKQERIIFKILGLNIILLLLFLITLTNSLIITMHIYFINFELSFYLRIGVILLGAIIYYLLGCNTKKIFDKIFMAKPYQNDERENFIHQIYPNVKLYYFKSNDLKLATAFALEGKQKRLT